MYDNTMAHNYFLAEQEERRRSELAKSLSDKVPVVGKEIFYEGALGFYFGIFLRLIDDEIGEVEIYGGEKKEFNRWLPVANEVVYKPVLVWLIYIVRLSTVKLTRILI